MKKTAITILVTLILISCKAHSNNSDGSYFKDELSVKLMIEDGILGFFDLTLADNYESALLKLQESERNTITGENIISGLFVIVPSDQILEEHINLNYYASYYNGVFCTFSKFAIDGEDYRHLDDYFQQYGSEEVLGDFIYRIIINNGFRFSLISSANSSTGDLNIIDIEVAEKVDEELRNEELNSSISGTLTP